MPFTSSGRADVQAFFLQEGVSLTAGLEAYFARRYATDQDFRDAYTVEGLGWGRTRPSQKQRQLRQQWQRRRMDFFRYYGLRASANFSLGSHDEWNIFQPSRPVPGCLTSGAVMPRRPGVWSMGTSASSWRASSTAVNSTPTPPKCCYRAGTRSNREYYPAKAYANNDVVFLAQHQSFPSKAVTTMVQSGKRR